MSVSSNSAVFNVAISNYLQFNNPVTDKGNRIGYNLAFGSTGVATGSGALDIIGYGTGTSRSIKLWDNVTVNNGLTLGSTTTTGSLNIYNGANGIKATITAAGAITGTSLSAGTGTITTSGTISTTGLGQITSAGLLTAGNGFTATTGIINIDASTTGSVLKAITKSEDDYSTNVATTQYVKDLFGYITTVPPLFTSNSLTYNSLTYTVSSSSTYADKNDAYKVFNVFDSGNSWKTADDTYDSVTGDQLKNTTTNIIGSGIVLGEWVQIYLPNIYILSKYSLISIDNFQKSSAKNWYVLGSNDGVNFAIIDQQTNYTWSSYNSEMFFLPNNNINNTKYQYYRLVLNKNNGWLTGGFNKWGLFYNSTFKTNGNVLDTGSQQVITAAKTFLEGINSSIINGITRGNTDNVILLCKGRFNSDATGSFTYKDSRIIVTMAIDTEDTCYLITMTGGTYVTHVMNITMTNVEHGHSFNNNYAVVAMSNSVMPLRCYCMVATTKYYRPFHIAIWGTVP